MDQVKIFTPASVANVSCGFDVLGFCLEPVGDEMVIRKQNLRLKNYQNRRSKPPLDVKNVAGSAAEAMLKAHPKSRALKQKFTKTSKPVVVLEVKRALPGLFFINELLGKPFTAHELIAFAMEGEALASGSAHADNVAPVLMGGITLVRSIDPIDVIQLAYTQS